MAKLIGVTGGKGGTGKSTIATALAHELAKANNVLLVDADADCPNDHLLLDIEREHKHDVSQRIPLFDNEKCIKCGRCGEACTYGAIISIKGKNPIFTPSQCNGCGACEIACPAQAISWGGKTVGKIFSGNGHGINLLSGELKPGESISELVVSSLNEDIMKVKDQYDYIIIDTAAGTHCPVIKALGMCDIAFAVTEPTPLGEHDTDLIIELLGKMEKESYLVINRADAGDRKLIERISKDRDVRIVGEIPYSKGIVDMYSSGRPITLGRVMDDIKKVVEQ